MGSDVIVEVFKRHGPLHNANIKFGTIVVVLSIAFVFVRYFALWFYEKSWDASGRSTSHAKWVRLNKWLVLLIFALVLAVLNLVEPHYDHIATHIRRLGRIAYALVPLNILLAARPAYFSLDNYLNTIQLHKLVSRIIVVLGILHSVFFIIWYANENKLERVLIWQNVLGVVIFIGCNIMLAFWKPVRNLCYKLFYICHNIFMIAFVVLIALHSRPGIGYITAINAALLFAHYVIKYVNSKEITFNEIIEHPNSTLKIIRFPKALLPENYLPASHVRIGYSKWSPLFPLLPSHPYTLASNYGDRDTLASLIVKETRFNIVPFDTYSMQPNLRSSLSKNFFDTAENVTIVSGGSGVSLGVGIFQYFKNQIVNQGKELKLKFIWITRSEEDIFILEELNIHGVEVYITMSKSETLTSNGSQDDEEIELDTLVNPFQHPDDPPTDVESSFINAVAIGKRPNLTELVTPHLNKTIDYANKWIISCGPVSLINECEVLAHESKCQFFSEEYSM